MIDIEDASKGLLMSSLPAQFVQYASILAMMPVNLHINNRLSVAQLSVCGSKRAVSNLVF